MRSGCLLQSHIHSPLVMAAKYDDITSVKQKVDECSGTENYVPSPVTHLRTAHDACRGFLFPI